MRIRAAVVVVAAAVLATAWPPTASAAWTSDVVVTGTLALNGPVDAPCTAGPCPPPIILSPPPFLGKIGPLFSVEGGQLRMASFTQASCSPAPCTVVLSSSFRGYCGLATGRGTGGIRDASGEVYLLEFTITVVGAELAVRGHARRQSTGELGDVFGTLALVPSGATCVSMPAAGSLVVTYPKPTP